MQTQTVRGPSLTMRGPCLAAKKVPSAPTRRSSATPTQKAPDAPTQSLHPPAKVLTQSPASAPAQKIPSPAPVQKAPSPPAVRRRVRCQECGQTIPNKEGQPPKTLCKRCVARQTARDRRAQGLSCRIPVSPCLPGRRRHAYSAKGKCVHCGRIKASTWTKLSGPRLSGPRATDGCEASV